MKKALSQENKARCALQQDLHRVGSQYKTLLHSYQTLYRQHSQASERSRYVQSALDALEVAYKKETGLRKTFESELNRVRGNLLQEGDCKLTELHGLGKTNKGLHSDIQGKNAEISELRRRNGAFEQEKLYLSTIIKEKATDMVSLQETNAALESELHSVKEMNAVSTLQIASAAKLIAERESETTELKKEISTLISSRDESQEINLHLQDECKSQKLQLESLKTELMALFPGLYGDLSNLSELLAETGTERRSKKRKTLKQY